MKYEIFNCIQISFDVFPTLDIITFFIAVFYLYKIKHL
jgi:hypothetical protein